MMFDHPVIEYIFKHERIPTCGVGNEYIGQVLLTIHLIVGDYAVVRGESDIIVSEDLINVVARNE